MEAVGRDWPGWGETWQQSAAVHRHSLDRLNTANESQKSCDKLRRASSSIYIHD